MDKKNKNNHWQDVIQKERENVNTQWQEATQWVLVCQLVSHTEMDDFWRMTHLMVGGHMIHIPDTITYSSVVTRETVCFALTMAVLHDIEIKAADVWNAYMMSPNREKILTVLGQDFGDDAGKSAIIVRALYGHEFIGASFRAHLAQCMQELCY